MVCGGMSGTTLGWIATTPSCGRSPRTWWPRPERVWALRPRVAGPRSINRWEVSYPRVSLGPVTSDEPLIHARGLVKRFGDFTAVDGIDVDVARGEAFGFLGPNGAGKSSTMRMIGCVSPSSGGELTILGLDPVKDGPAIRARLGVVPQDDTLDVELTVRENL